MHTSAPSGVNTTIYTTLANTVLYCPQTHVLLLVTQRKIAHMNHPPQTTPTVPTSLHTEEVTFSSGSRRGMWRSARLWPCHTRLRRTKR